MADADLKPSLHHPERSATVQQSRRYRSLSTLLYSPSRYSEPASYPWIRIAGRWLELAGFSPHQRVRIEVQDGRLVITPI
ncbi:SymE family type I addiction module toxin [Paraburkholderia hayleyella]|uniref:SymE family type I addiction module toxin n=1 Tax=Paraburkholderia hayleyella TaxID=2152889 RepID=UPI0012917EF7|nr:SymE family type I addiction module toxin [Paraburkholderia hayleyella]